MTRPVKKSAGLLLTPGAGSSADHPGLVAIEKALAEAVPAIAVLRMDFPYRLAGRRAPDRSPVLLDAVREGFDDLQQGLPKGAPVAVGGRSMGGRICSMAVADGLAAGGLICLSYPLHPPGKPERLRVEHLPDVRIPSLFVSGRKDTFGTPAELQTHLATLGGPHTLSLLDGVGHDLKGQEAKVASLVGAWLVELLR